MGKYQGRGEKKSTTKTQDLRGVPNALPALIRAAKVQKKAAEVGFDWNDAQGALDKIREETDELTEAGNRTEVTEELGDLLFSIVNAARFFKVDPEDALNMATKKNSLDDSLTSKIEACLAESF